MDIKKIRVRWKREEPHQDTTLDYAISEIYKLCDEIEELQARREATEKCIGRQQIKTFYAEREENSIQLKLLKEQGDKADLADQLRSARGIITQREQEVKSLQSTNDEQKEALGKPHKCEGCDEMIYYQDYCTRCKRQWES